MVLTYICAFYDPPTTYLHIIKKFKEPFKNKKIDGKKINVIEIFCCLIYNNDDIVLDIFSMLKSHGALFVIMMQFVLQF